MIGRRVFTLLAMLLIFAACMTPQELAKPPSTSLQPSPQPVLHEVRVIDGDTFVIDGEKIRVIGVDTMEYHHKQKKWVMERLRVSNISCLNYYGEQAYIFARNTLLSMNLSVERVKQDRYGRTLAYVTLCNVSGCYDYGELLLQQGLAIVYPYESFEKKQYYYSLESNARASGRGIWSCS